MVCEEVFMYKFFPLRYLRAMQSFEITIGGLTWLALYFLLSYINSFLSAILSSEMS